MRGLPLTVLFWSVCAQCAATNLQGAQLGFKKHCQDNESGVIKCVQGLPDMYFTCNNPIEPMLMPMAAGTSPCKGPVVPLLPDLKAYLSLFPSSSAGPTTSSPPPPTNTPTTSSAPPTPSTTDKAPETKPSDPPKEEEDCPTVRTKFGCVGHTQGPLGGTLMEWEADCDLHRWGFPQEVFDPKDGELVCEGDTSKEYYHCKYGSTSPKWSLADTKDPPRRCICANDVSGWGNAQVVDSYWRTEVLDY